MQVGVENLELGSKKALPTAQNHEKQWFSSQNKQFLKVLGATSSAMPLLLHYDFEKKRALNPPAWQPPAPVSTALWRPGFVSQNKHE